MDFIAIARALGALAITVGLMVGLAMVLRRFGLLQAPGMPMAGAERRLSVREQLWLEPGRTRLMIVRCDGSEHLVLLGPQGASRLAEIPAAAPALDPAAPSGRQPAQSAPAGPLAQTSTLARTLSAAFSRQGPLQ